MEKLELAVDSQAACISKLADEIMELQKKQDVHSAVEEEAGKSMEDKWDEGISRIMNYDPMRR